MTTSPPDGPSRDLRERCAHAYYRLRWARDDWQHMAPVHREAYYEVADAILTEITRSGHSIIATDRLERLIRGGRHARNSCMTRNDGWMCNYPEVLERDLLGLMSHPCYRLIVRVDADGIERLVVRPSAGMPSPVTDEARAHIQTYRSDLIAFVRQRDEVQERLRGVP